MNERSTVLAAVVDQEQRPSLRWPSLDGVRGLAFLLVALFHLNEFLRHPFFLADGQVGVWLFFVLSSYLLSRPLLADPSSMLRASTWTRYGVRRVLRVFPLFVVYVVCLSTIAHVPWGKSGQVLLLQTTHAVDWSLFIECRFYLVLPFLLLPLAVLGRPRRYWCFLLLVVVVAAAAFPFWRDPGAWPFAGYPISGLAGNAVLLSYLSCFLPGVIAAYASVRWSPSPQRLGVWCDGVGILVLLSLPVIPLLVPQGEPGHAAYYFRLVHLWFPYACLFSLWVFLLGLGQGVFARLLASPAFRFLGAISYPGYLFHLFVYYRLRPVITDDRWYAIAAFAAVCAVSYLLHRAIERPLSKVWSGKAG